MCVHVLSICTFTCMALPCEGQRATLRLVYKVQSTVFFETLYNLELRVWLANDPQVFTYFCFSSIEITNMCVCMGVCVCARVIETCGGDAYTYTQRSKEETGYLTLSFSTISLRQSLTECEATNPPISCSSQD